MTIEIGTKLTLKQVAQVVVGIEDAAKKEIVKVVDSLVTNSYGDCFTFKGSKSLYRLCYNNTRVQLIGSKARRMYDIIPNN